MKDFLSRRWLVFYGICTAVVVFCIYLYRVDPQQVEIGNPAMTTLMMFSRFLPKVFARDELYHDAVAIYPVLFLKLRWFLYNFFNQDLLLSTKFLFWNLFAFY